MKHLFTATLLLLALLMPATTHAHDFEVDGIYYNVINDNEAEVTYKGLNYSDYSNVYSGDITIPPTVAFNGTTYSVTSIGDAAFCGCSSLNRIVIPNSVTHIGYEAFYGTGWFDNQPDGLVYAGLVAYKYKGTMPNGTELSIKDGTKGIAGGAFDGCKSLTNITIPNTVTNIGNYAFCECSALTCINIPNSVTTISDGAFVCCSELTCINIPNSVTNISNYTFQGCSSLTNISLPNSITTIGDCAFWHCYALTSINIPDSVTTIGYGAFYECTGLTEINIGNSVTTIKNAAFYGCTGLASINIPNSVTTIGNEAFSGCTGITTIEIGNSVTEIGMCAFDCYGLTRVDITDLEAWCKIAFEDPLANPLFSAKHLYLNNSEVSDLIIPNSITCIGDYAFTNCDGLTSVTIPNSVTTIGNSAFLYCNGLETVTIPNSVTTKD